MKNLVILLVMLSFNSCFAQKDVDIYYKTAFDYIVSLPEFKGNGLRVSDKLVHIDISNFYEELSEGNLEAMLFKLDSIDNERNMKKHVSPKLQDISSSKSAVHYLFFSEIIDNMLLAEVIENKGLKNPNYERLTSFNNSKVFLLIFNQNKELKKVYFKEIQYD